MGFPESVCLTQSPHYAEVPASAYGRGRAPACQQRGQAGSTVFAPLTSSKSQLYVNHGRRAGEVLPEGEGGHLAPHAEGQAEDVPLLVRGELAAVALPHQPPAQGPLGEGLGAPSLRRVLGLPASSRPEQRVQEALGAGLGAGARQGRRGPGCGAHGLQRGPRVGDAAAGPVHGRQGGRVQPPARRQRVDLLEPAQSLSQGGTPRTLGRPIAAGTPGHWAREPRPRRPLGPAVFGQEPLRGRNPGSVGRPASSACCTLCSLWFLSAQAGAYLLSGFHIYYVVWLCVYLCWAALEVQHLKGVCTRVRVCTSDCVHTCGRVHVRTCTAVCVQVRL